ncbi:MAG: class E sortase [Acidimicrobiia bacterium]|nr:class E sortase [Acidimicrobiia bacterium]
MPGQIGNAAIAGHRTTYGAPFNRLDELEAGDFILTQSLVGEYVYVVTELLVVAPTEVSVVADTPGEPWLTLTTCNPEFSARERLVVKAKMVEERSDRPTRPTPRPRSEPSNDTDPDAGALPDEQSLESGLAGDSGSRAPAALWGFLAAVSGLIWWWAFRRWRHPLTWLGGVAPFLVVLFVFYMYLERTLPAGY